MPSFLLTPKPDQPTMGWFINRLQEKGFQVFQTFNLQASDREDSSCSCPFRAKACDCLVAVLLVYKDNSGPATLFIHSRQRQFWLLLNDNQPNTAILAMADRVVSELAIQRWP